jgi:lipopolysaccharide/colanic/teichoic acid biosynthesis glycosyltransferase
VAEVSRFVVRDAESAVSTGGAACPATSRRSGLTPRILEHRPSAPYQRVVKPTVDLFGAGALLVLLLPVLLAVALAVRVKLGRGIIYRQERTGRNGKPFVMYKFRTMHPDRRRAQIPFQGPDRRISHKRDDDPRHTPLGRFLRRSSLDELPQLWNVIRGNMSLVGPRPELPHVVARYQPWQHQRHRVKPGLTGFWQVSERAGGLAYEGVHLDIQYLHQVSLRTDLRVLLRTVPVTMRRTGR